MPGTSRAANPRGYTIEFDEATHAYRTTLTAPRTVTGAMPRGGNVPFCKLGQLAAPEMARVGNIFYVSGTKLVHHFFPQFDPDGKIAERKARQQGVSADEIRAQWKRKADAACALGTRVHETCEDVLHGPDLAGEYNFRNYPQTQHEKLLFAAGFDAVQRVKRTMEVVGIEQIVFDVDTQIAGTIDLLCRDRANPNLYWVLDWKTNEKIEFSNRYGVHGLFPIAHLEDCSAVRYSLQLSLYEYLLRIGLYVPHNAEFRRGIFHLTDAGPKFYELPDRSIEVRDMIIAVQTQPPF